VKIFLKIFWVFFGGKKIQVKTEILVGFRVQRVFMGQRADWEKKTLQQLGSPKATTNSYR